MIYHVSIPVENPEHVARIMSELMGGPVMQFVPGPGSFVIFSQYQDGTSIEVVPTELRHTPGKAVDEGINYDRDSGADRAGDSYSAFHVAMASPLSTEEILAIGEREGWRAVRCWRATAFPLVELWIENRFMIEFFPPDMQQQIVEFMRDPATWCDYFGLKERDGIYCLSEEERAAMYAAVKARAAQTPAA